MRIDACNDDAPLEFIGPNGRLPFPPWHPTACVRGPRTDGADGPVGVRQALLIQPVQWIVYAELDAER